MTTQEMKEWTIATVARAQAGDQTALDELLRRLLPYAYRIARYEQKRSDLSSRDHTFAEAAASHAVFMLYKRLSDITVPESSGLSAWLHTVIRNYFIDLTKSKKSRAEIPTDQIGAFDTRTHSDSYPCERPLLSHHMRGALTRLTSDELNLFIMRFHDGASNAAVAVTLGTSETAIKGRSTRVLAKVRRLLKEVGYKEGGY
ncbi:MAG TPA: RNA polymerase sigma factor [Magnetospirillaceae bacterium]|nr:RNA polymerase sigma factor [Magnetospirillaceae bacterium]